MNFVICSSRRASPFVLLVLFSLCLGIARCPAELVDAWRADALNLFDEGDAIGSWTSAGNRNALAVSGAQPILRKSATPGGSSVLRFDRHWMTVESSPVAGLRAFSIALVFKASAVGTNTSTQWYGKSGIIDAEQGGVTADWGLAIDERGRLAFGSGQPDVTTTISGNSLVDSNYHVAVLTWGGGAQAVYLDDRPVAKRTTGASTAARNSGGFSFGAIHTSDAALGRRFVGDLAEVRFYSTSLNPTEATNVLLELKSAHLDANLPGIKLFSASTNNIYIGESVTLSWAVTNYTGLGLDPLTGAIAGPTGSLIVKPAETTTYVLSATNSFGVRTASVTVFVDPGIPSAFPQSVVTIRNVARPVQLAGSDPNGGTLTYAIRGAPGHGTLTGTPPNLTYQPAADFFGNDEFTFVVNDGSHDSPPATVTIRVDPLPTAPSLIVLSTTNLVHPAGVGSFAAALRTVDANPLDTHFYTLVTGAGSRDNRYFSVSGNQLELAAPLTAQTTSNLLIRVRTTDSAGLFWEQALVFGVGVDTSRVVINEVHYNGVNNTVREEFIELYNPRETPVDLSGWRLQGGIDYLFPAGSILQPRSFIVVAQDPTTLQRVYSVSALGPWSGGLNNEGEELTLRDRQGVLMDRVEFRSEFPWPIAANGGGGSMELRNPTLDNNLGSSWATSLDPALPSPGRTNRTFTVNAPPNQRQVEHHPKQPTSTNEVTITVKVTDPEGVASVRLEYQVVTPGNFIPSILPYSISALNSNPLKPPLPNPAYESNWVSVVMVDNGLFGDEVAGDDVFTAVLPRQAHRTLVRYRITAEDSFGASRRAPFEDDESLNFAYFVYNGVPDYFGNSSAALTTLPVYHLITRSKDLLDCNGYDGLPQLEQFNGSVANEARYVFNWPGALVYDGEVYDHIRYRLRGANGRYQEGKRNMRFKFNDGRHFQARDRGGKRYPNKWASLTTGKGSSNRLTLTWALNEVVNYFLWNKVGVPAPLAHFFHFRVVQGVEEAPDAYRGDFWGLSWGQENYDVRFLETHGLPKGNLYKLINAQRSDDVLVDQQRQERYQAPFAVTNSADAFNIQTRLNATQSSDWLLAHVNYSNWYRFHAIAEGVRHYDYWPSANKNAAWYFEPIYTQANSFLGRMWTFPWDTDSTWGPTWNSGYDAPYNGIYAIEGGGTRKAELIVEYLNVVREMRDLLFQPDQLMPVIDALAADIQAFVPADMQRWSNAPTATNPRAISQAAYRSLSAAGPGLTGGLAAYVADMKRFAFVGGYWPDGEVPNGGQAAYLDTLARDTAIPARPTISFTGSPGYPLDALTFRCSAFSDPQGPSTFAALRWRVAEVLTTNLPITSVEALRLEWDAVWESGELTPFKDEIRVPGAFLKPGLRYRARVQHKDTTGRWSRWSEPAEFIPTPADVLGGLRENLVISELMYHPSAPGELDEDAYEFIEFKNIGSRVLDLTGVALSGVDYTFTNGSRLDPGERWLLVRDLSAFQRRYPGIPVHGVYGGKLDNGGETIQWTHPQGVLLGSLSYGDRAPWPVTADGLGFSLVLADPVRGLYRGSARSGGSPGQEDPPSTIAAVVVEEIMASPDGLGLDAIELRNLTTQLVDISGWWLTDDASLPKKFRLPAGSVLAAGGYLTFDETQFNPAPGSDSSFALSSLGEEVYLFSSAANGDLTGYSHGWSFGGSPDGGSLGRFVNSAGEESFPPQSRATLGTTNSAPAVGPVILSEVHYHPLGGDDEFVEIYNRTDAAVGLFSSAFPTNRWRLSGVDFVFPTNFVLAAKQAALVVKGTPVEFRNRHGIPPQIPVLGPYSGSLQQDGERLELQAPASPSAGGVPYYAVDQVRFRDRAPWPVAADGSGAALHRRVLDAYGSDPAQWTAALPSPGQVWVTGNAPVVVQSPGDLTVVAGQEARFAVQVSGPQPWLFQWRFQGDRIPGATHSSFTLVDAALTDEGSYAVDVVNPFGSVSSASARLNVLLPARILAHPRSIFARPGSNVVFSVTADSATALRYQWQRDGVDLAGAQSAVLQLPNIALTDAGSYRVKVTDGVGTVFSEAAALTLLIDPVIVQPPLSSVTVSGGSVTFSVRVTNLATLPITYRWKRGSADLSGGVLTLDERVAFMTVTNILAPLTNFSVTVSNLAVKTALTSPVATVALLPDTDRDGLPDPWESQWGLSPNLATDAALDADGDRSSNLAEFLAGTDPRDPASALRLEGLGWEANGVWFGFQAISNRTYTVDFTDNLTAPVWTRLADYLALPVNRAERFIDPVGGTNRYYRVQTPRRRP